MQTQGSAARIGGQGFSLRFISGETFIHTSPSLRCVAHELEYDVTSTPNDSLLRGSQAGAHGGGGSPCGA